MLTQDFCQSTITVISKGLIR